MLRPAEVDPGFKICLNTIAVSKVKDTPPIFVWEVWIWMNLGSRPLSQCSFNFRAIGLKLVKCFGFWTLLIFCYTTHLEPMVSLCTAITYFLLTKQRLRNPNQLLVFLPCVRILWVLAPKHCQYKTWSGEIMFSIMAQNWLRGWQNFEGKKTIFPESYWSKD